MAGAEAKNRQYWAEENYGANKLARTFLLWASALFSALAAIIAPAASQELVTEIPYRYDYDGWITVSVQVNGQGPYDFIVDSAATLSVVFENLASEQTFPFVDDEPKRILGLIEADNLPPRFIGDLEIGGQQLSNLTSVVVPEWPAPRETPHGVLGLDFLTRYAVEIDPGDLTIRLYRNGRPAVTRNRGWSRTHLRPRLFNEEAKPLHFIEAQIGGEDYPFILDLGASSTIINFEMARAMFRVAGYNINDHNAASRVRKVQDLFGNEESSRFVRVRRISIGRAHWRNHILLVYNSKVFEELGVANQPYGLLGADLLRGRPIVLDFPDERLYLGPREKEGR